MASTNIQTFPGKVGVSNTNPVHTLDIGSNVYIDDASDTKLRIFGNVHATGIIVDGDITVISTENLSVKDPVLLLASGSTGTSDTGIIMKRADGDSNVAVFYDEGVGLKICHTLSGGDDIHLNADTSNSLATSIYGPLTVVNSTSQALSVNGGAQIDGDLQVGTVASLFVDVSESNVGIGTNAPAYTLDVRGNANVGALMVTTIAGNGSALSSIQSSNVSDFVSNVTRITNLETSNGHIWSNLASNVTRISNLETSNGHIWSNLVSNVTRISNLEFSDITISGKKTFTDVVVLKGQKDNYDGNDRSSYWSYDSNVALVLEPAANDGAVAILFPSIGNNPSDFGYIVFDEEYGEAGVAAGENSALIIGCENGGTNSSDHVRVKSRLVVEADMSSSDPTNAFQVKSGNVTSDLFTVTRLGNVGVRTTSPDEALHVNGNIRIGSAAGTNDNSERYIKTSGQLVIHSNDSDLDDLYVCTSIKTGVSNVSAINLCGANTSSLYQHITFDTRNTERMRIDKYGNVGLGTTTPYAKLHVNGAAGAISSASRAYFNYGSNVVLDTGTWGIVSIYASDDIITNQSFASHAGTIGASDTRIKKNIVDADDAECLETLRLLKPKKYQYKDEINRGQEPVWGFIAQEVRDTLSYATELRRDVLPNIYELANVSSSNVITFVNFTTSNLESNATTLIRTKGIDGEDHDIHLVEVIDEHTIRVEEDLTEWIGSVDAEGNVITQIETTTLTLEEYKALEDKSGCVANISGYQSANVVISVEEYNSLEDMTGYEEVIENYTKTVTTYPGTQLFVYGQEVDDFVFLKKEAIWTVATAALQEVDQQLQAEKAKVATLETQISDLLARVQALENP